MVRSFLLLLSLGFAGFLQAQDAPVFTLQECIDKALENSLDIKEQQLAKAQLGINYHQSKMNQLPSVNASGAHNYNFGRTIDPFTNTFITQSIQSNNFSLNAGVTLYNGFVLRNTMLRSKNELERNEYVEQIIQNNLALAVADAYLQVVFAEQQLRNAEIQRTTTLAQLTRVRELVAAGSTNRSEQLNLEAQLANDDASILNAKGNIRLAYLTLSLLMQVPETETYRVAEVQLPSLDAAAAVDMQDVLERCLTELPEIKNAEEQEESAMFQEKIAKGSLYPSLSLFANANTLYSETRLERFNQQTSVIPIGYTSSNELVFSEIETFDTRTTNFGQQLSDNFGQAVGLRLSVPIFNNYRVKNNIELAKLNTQLSELNAERVKNQIRNDVVRSFTDYENARLNYAAAQKSYEAQKLNYDFMLQRYEAGLVNATDLLLTKNALLNAQNNLDRTGYQLIFTKTQLEFYRTGALILQMN
jgi:outer membrane protein